MESMTQSLAWHRWRIPRAYGYMLTLVSVGSLLRLLAKRDIRSPSSILPYLVSRVCPRTCTSMDSLPGEHLLFYIARKACNHIRHFTLTTGLEGRIQPKLFSAAGQVVR